MEGKGEKEESKKGIKRKIKKDNERREGAEEQNRRKPEKREGLDTQCLKL